MDIDKRLVCGRYDDCIIGRKFFACIYFHMLNILSKKGRFCQMKHKHTNEKFEIEILLQALGFLFGDLEMKL